MDSPINQSILGIADRIYMWRKDNDDSFVWPCVVYQSIAEMRAVDPCFWNDRIMSKNDAIVGRVARKEYTDIANNENSVIVRLLGSYHRSKLFANVDIGAEEMTKISRFNPLVLEAFADRMIEDGACSPSSFGHDKKLYNAWFFAVDEALWYLHCSQDLNHPPQRDYKYTVKGEALWRNEAEETVAHRVELIKSFYNEEETLDILSSPERD